MCAVYVAGGNREVVLDLNHDGVGNAFIAVATDAPLVRGDSGWP